MLRQADAAAGLPVAEAAEAEEGDEEDEGTGTAEVDARRGGYWKAAAGSPGATSSDRGSCSGSGKSSGRYIGVCLISSKSCCRSLRRTDPRRAPQRAATGLGGDQAHSYIPPRRLPAARAAPSVRRGSAW
eukprot:Mycagemm_TRINITY_DN10115_c0_g2::TRINITY_DN10115_c0_g2_i4::g.5293::m.5293 type:complete len:130 gc:universal TRINITY_DN10115_c0_g2_i4:287-676(+)